MVTPQAVTEWAAAAAPLHLLEGVTYEEIFAHCVPPPFWVYEHRRTIRAFEAMMVVVWTKVAENPKIEGWWKLMLLLPQLLLQAPKAPSDGAIAAIIQRCKMLRENTPAAWGRLLMGWRTAEAAGASINPEAEEEFTAVAARVHQLEARGEEAKGVPNNYRGGQVLSCQRRERRGPSAPAIGGHPCE